MEYNIRSLVFPLLSDFTLKKVHSVFTASYPSAYFTSRGTYNTTLDIYIPLDKPNDEVEYMLGFISGAIKTAVW